MKKFFAILLTLCMLASAFCIPALAADTPAANDTPAAGVVLRVSALDKKGKPVKLENCDYKSFEDGWNAAMAIAGDSDEMKAYSRIVVDLYADWKADDGVFTDDWWWNGPGFDWDTIYVPDDARVTLNMNGHTIDRGLTDNENNGEVICVDSDADIIINDGTIKGGHSDTGAGGIHVKSRVNITLNNVHIVGNAANEDDGGGIQLLGGSTLVMNGGSFRDNSVDGLMYQPTGSYFYGGAIFIDDSTATFTGVEFKNNHTTQWSNYGAAIYANDSTVTIDKCTFTGNGVRDDSIDAYNAISVVHALDSSIAVKESTFINNGGDAWGKLGYGGLFFLDNAELVMERSEFRDNKSYFIIADVDESLVCVTDTKFLDNSSSVMRGDGGTSTNSFFRGCTFNNCEHYKYPSFYDIKASLTFYNCSMGNTTSGKNSLQNLKFVNESNQTEAVLRVSALKQDGSVLLIASYNSFEEGWDYAMGLAADLAAMKANGYDRIIIDLLADWTAEKGVFGSSDNGFEWNTIYVPQNARITLNMNGHTINRGLTECYSDGEVIYIDEDTDVIINDGTIKGGHSDNGAGGINIEEDAKVTLTNVNVIDNKTTSDDGAGIAVYSDSVLVMNGGSLANNIASSGTVYGGGLYVHNSTVTLDGVAISGNEAYYGAAIYVNANGTATLNNCIVEGNALHTQAGSIDVIHCLGTLYINGGELKNNGKHTGKLVSDYSSMSSSHAHALIYCSNNITIAGTDSEPVKITGNHTSAIFSTRYANDVLFDIKYCEITDNYGIVGVALSSGMGNTGDKEYRFTSCKFNNNNIDKIENYDFCAEEQSVIVFDQCDLGGSTYIGKDHIKFDGGKGAASIFGTGSLTMLVSLFALVASITAIGISINLGKKKTAPASAKSDEK